MILELLFGGAALKLLHDVCTYDATVGIRCKLCNWQYRVGPHYEYDHAARAEADRVFRMHVSDMHPSVREGAEK